MAGILKLVYIQEFVNTDTIEIIHNSGYEYLKAKVIVDGNNVESLIKSILTDKNNPTNILTVTLASSQTGIVQLFGSDVTSIGENSATELHVVPEVVQDAINEEVTTLSGIINEIVSGYHYISDDKLLSTTSTSWVNRISLPITISNEGEYRVGWSFIWNYSHTSNTACFQIIVDEDEENIISEYYIEPKDKHNYQRFPLCGFKPVFLNEGIHIIMLRMRSYRKGHTVRIYSAVLEAQKI